MAYVELENVSMVFDGDVVAVDDVSIEIGNGELLVLVGPSGSGKSTALRTIAGLEQPTSGEIYIDGEDVTNVSPQERDVAMVFQSFALYPHRTVRGNIAFPLQAKNYSRSEIDEHVEQVADTLGIPELLDRKPAQLSGGQQQRVALGRAIVRDPQVFLMDEPLANLDAKLRKEMRLEVVRLQQELGTTMIHVTHNQEEAMTMGDRIAVMNDGRIQQLAPPDIAYNLPANLFVADFIGSPSMNFLEGRVVNDYFETDDESISIKVPDNRLERITSEEVTLGIRPEDIDLVDKVDDYTFTSTVDVVENMGNIKVVYFTLGGRELLAEADPDRTIRQGEEITVRLDPSKLHLFDGRAPESERVPTPDETEQVSPTD